MKDHCIKKINFLIESSINMQKFKLSYKMCKWHTYSAVVSNNESKITTKKREKSRIKYNYSIHKKGRYWCLVKIFSPFCRTYASQILHFNEPYICYNQNWKQSPNHNLKRRKKRKNKNKTIRNTNFRCRAFYVRPNKGLDKKAKKKKKVSLVCFQEKTLKV